jgi:hypothetical protein
MAHRLIAGLAVAAAVLVAAPAAQATLVYVKKPNSAKPQVWLARDDGSHGRRLGIGTWPTISPDGRWVAWQTLESRARVMLVKATGRSPRRIVRSSQVGEFRFSGDSKKLGIAVNSRLMVYDLPTRTGFTAAHGNIRGFSFSGDSGSVVYGTSGRSDAVDAPSDLYALEFDAGPRTRVTRDRKSLNPLWLPDGSIVFDRMRHREGDAPSYNLFSIHADGGALRRLTSLRIPPLLSGLMPLEASADGRRLLAEFVGQDTSVGFAVNPRTGSARSLSRELETGFVASDLSADGRVVLGMSGGPDPSARHHVVTVPYTGGEPKVLVRRAAYPDWSR